MTKKEFQAWMVNEKAKLKKTNENLKQSKTMLTDEFVEKRDRKFKTQEELKKCKMAIDDA